MAGFANYSYEVLHPLAGFSIYNRFTMKHIRSILAYEKSDIAQLRLKVIEFSTKYGVSAAVDAFLISRRTLYRWKKILKDSEGILEALIPRSTSPKTKRAMITDTRIIAYIRSLRETYGRLGKEKIKPLLDEYCQTIGTQSISISTIGKVIKRHHLYVQKTKRIYHDPLSGFAGRKIRYKTKVRYSPKVKELGYIEIDTIAKFINGLKAYIFNAVDVKLKFQFSYGYSTLTSRNGLDFFKRLELVYPITNGIHTIQTDNGLEYLGEFHSYLEAKNLKHFFIYPRCPKINGFVERANRTLQEEFIDGNLEYVLDGLPAFNARLIDYLVWYNTKRVHKSLGNVSPINYLLSIIPKECQMYVTHTKH